MKGRKISSGIIIANETILSLKITKKVGILTHPTRCYWYLRCITGFLKLQIYMKVKLDISKDFDKLI